MPEGWYVGNNIRERSTPEGMACPNNKGWSLDITDKDDREDLRIHPEDKKGTLGCIGVNCGEGSDELYEDLKEYLEGTNDGHILLKVKYNDY